MKQKDIVLVIVIAFVSAVVAFLVSSWVFSGEQSREQTAEVIDVITPDFNQPSEKYFNANVINPTKLIEIGGETNPNPFGENAQ